MPFNPFVHRNPSEFKISKNSRTNGQKSTFTTENSASITNSIPLMSTETGLKSFQVHCARTFEISFLLNCALYHHRADLKRPWTTLPAPLKPTLRWSSFFSSFSPYINRLLLEKVSYLHFYNIITSISNSSFWIIDCTILYICIWPRDDLND